MPKELVELEVLQSRIEYLRQAKGRPLTDFEEVAARKVAVWANPKVWAAYASGFRGQVRDAMKWRKAPPGMPIP